VAAVRSLVVGSIIPFTIAIPTRPALAQPAAPTDADIVFCLSPAQRGQLSDAAVSLKLASPGKRPGGVVVTTAGIDTEISVERWRELRTDDFNRACAALAGSARPAPAVTVAPTASSNGLGSTLIGLIPVAFGALLGGATAALSSWWKDLTTTRRALAADLTSTMRLLRTSTERFIASRGDSDDQIPARAALQQAQADAVGAVRRLNLTYPDRPQPTELEELLTDADLQDTMNLGWHADAKKLDERRLWLRARVGRMDLLAVGIAAALQRRGRFPRDWPTPKPAGSGTAAPEDKAAAE
jgi:hypothetical protein